MNRDEIIALMHRQPGEVTGRVPDNDKAVLASIASVLVKEGTSVKNALDAAYALGKLAGQIEMAKVAEETVRGLMKEIG